MRCDSFGKIRHGSTFTPWSSGAVAHKGFPKQQNLLQAFISDFSMNPHKPIEQQPKNEYLTSFLKGLKVVAYIGGDTSRTGQKREFIVNGLSEPADRHTFRMDLPNGGHKMITVAEYFQKVKNVRLQYPRLNCVWVGPKDKNIYYPMELLEVAYGHARNKQLNDKQLSTMVKQAATPPDERKRKIEEVIKDMNYTGNKDFKQFGLEISDKFFAVQAKVLPAPQLETGDPRVTTPRNGAWNAQKLLKAETLQRWGFIVIEPSSRFPPDYGGIIAMIKSCGIQMGMTVTEPVVKHFNLQIKDLKNMLFKCLDEQVKFLFIVVSTRGKDYYHKVKQMAERDVGILTQCIKEFTAEKRMNPQTVRNILLKVNSKLMGINQALDNRSMPACLKQGRVMVVGADVTHPSPEQKEMIVEFEDMMVEHLTLYRQRNGALPTKVFVFRDGVSEGQFAQVMNSELLAVHQAYQRLAGTAAKPEVLFLLVQKRHHTSGLVRARKRSAEAGKKTRASGEAGQSNKRERGCSANGKPSAATPHRITLSLLSTILSLFFENNPRNVEPGTVVDRDIVHATELDFYLVSHQAIKGTARPTRYHAVCNDGGLKHDEVEQLTYYLCHLYSRCMRSVSYPTPTYYAHLACLRARSLTYEEKFDNAGLEKAPKRLRVLDKMLQYSRMFFVKDTGTGQRKGRQRRRTEEEYLVEQAEVRFWRFAGRCRGTLDRFARSARALLWSQF
ncbi:hypothetical protein MSG28_006428 [Choristoneura fumiferana]|uniref:Uncharacterized protein n=1 Tax=Choristoneura fumiferana TaxID=7141 RepID=A0ACC0JF13_CHOFU|nr:hypothetical protein MSG28_006428 [Choristoneura fumiferana]